jgi:hypothetical protein
MFGVTISFLVGASFITVALNLLVVSGVDIGFAREVDDWIAQCIVIVIIATLSGLTVDALRFLAARFLVQGDDVRTHS